MQTTGQIGPAGPIASGSPSVAYRQGNYGELMFSELNGRYYEQSIRGNVFIAVNNAAQALSVASGTYTGLSLGNPTGSGKNFVILEAIWATTIVPTAAGAVVLGYAPYVAPGGAAATGPISTVIGLGANSVAKVGSTTTFGAAPTIVRPMVGIGWSSAVGLSSFQYKDDIGGAVIIPPGYSFCIEAITTAITGIASFAWAELSATIL
jgi:hypothetical protein